MPFVPSTLEGPLNAPNPGDKPASTTDFVVQTGKQVALEAKVYKTAAQFSGSTKALSNIFGRAAMHAPVLSAAVSTLQDGSEISGYLKEGKYGKAGIGAAAGVIEVTGNVAGFGYGDFMREGIRAGAIKMFGEDYAINKSDLRQLSESTADVLVGMKKAPELPAAPLETKFLTNTSLPWEQVRTQVEVEFKPMELTIKLPPNQPCKSNLPKTPKA